MARLASFNILFFHERILKKNESKWKLFFQRKKQSWD